MPTSKKFFLNVIILFFVFVAAFSAFMAVSWLEQADQLSYQSLVGNKKINNDVVAQPDKVPVLDLNSIKQAGEDNCNKLVCKKSGCITKEGVPVCLAGYYTQAAIAKNSKEACNLIESDINKSNCLDNYYINASLAQRNPEYCKSLSDSNQRISCANQVYFYLAAQDPATAKTNCAKISTQGLKDLCLNRYTK